MLPITYGKGSSSPDPNSALGLVAMGILLASAVERTEGDEEETGKGVIVGKNLFRILSSFFISYL